MARKFPLWAEEINRLLPVRSQFILSGNIRDIWLIQEDGKWVSYSQRQCLWLALQECGYRFSLIYDPVDGVSVYPNTAREEAVRDFSLTLNGDGFMPANLDTLAGLMRQVAFCSQGRTALLVDFASRLVGNAQQMGEEQRRFFVACEKLATVANPLGPQGGPHLFNPIIWMTHRRQDLPPWFSLDSQRIAVLSLPVPDNDTRLNLALTLGKSFVGYDARDDIIRKKCTETFAGLTDAMRLQDMADIATLARRNKTSYEDADDAVRLYKVGRTDNPWKQPGLKEKIRQADAQLNEAVIGQPDAVKRALDILKRSVTGLTGAHATSSPGRPRGVLFFAGPTGVGKTELAKQLSKIIFGDEGACVRFDMSEYNHEHSDTRLIGAPPSYVGYESGGQLTNQVRQRPFSVLLFDEIDKAHPLILDKFLQILEDGRLTDGQGETVYFSEALIVFTTNLGIIVDGPDGKPVQNVHPGDPYEKVVEEVTKAIKHAFTYKFQRPELRNRLGENIVVFNFIERKAAKGIFERMLANVVNRVADELRIKLVIEEGVKNYLCKWCTADLSYGGRDIGNKLESAFVNPLARSLFDIGSVQAGVTLHVTNISEQTGRFTVTLESKTPGLRK